VIGARGGPTAVPERMTVAEYAAYRRRRGLPGGTPQAVYAAIRDGRIALADGWIDRVGADQAWRANTDMSRYPARGYRVAQAPLPERLAEAQREIRQLKRLLRQGAGASRARRLET
jgi:hypothetical protein